MPFGNMTVNFAEVKDVPLRKVFPKLKYPPHLMNKALWAFIKDNDLKETPSASVTKKGKKKAR